MLSKNQHQQPISELKSTPQLCFPKHLNIKPTCFTVFLWFLFPPSMTCISKQNKVLNTATWIPTLQRNWWPTRLQWVLSPFCQVRWFGTAYGKKVMPCFRRGRWWGVIFLKGGYFITQHKFQCVHFWNVVLGWLIEIDLVGWWLALLQSVVGNSFMNQMISLQDLLTCVEKH